MRCVDSFVCAQCFVDSFVDSMCDGLAARRREVIPQLVLWCMALCYVRRGTAQTLSDCSYIIRKRPFHYLVFYGWPANMVA